MRGRYPKASRPIQSDDGIASRRKRGAFVDSWWAERWIAALEAVMDTGRLQRGRRYARAGQVLSLEFERGMAVTKAQGSRRTPYRITIGLTPLSDATRKRVIKALSQHADLPPRSSPARCPPPSTSSPRPPRAHSSPPARSSSSSAEAAPIGRRYATTSPPAAVCSESNSTKTPSSSSDCAAATKRRCWRD
jgi:hypothetical protein